MADSAHHDIGPKLPLLALRALRCVTQGAHEGRVAGQASVAIALKSSVGMNNKWDIKRISGINVKGVTHPLMDNA